MTKSNSNKSSKRPSKSKSTKRSSTRNSSFQNNVPIVGVGASALNDRHDSAGQTQQQPDDGLGRIFVLLRNHMQVDFSNYKLTTLERRIERRMMVRKIENLDAYVQYLQGHSEEVRALFADILIQVTGFFRDPDSFKALVDQVFPNLKKKEDLTPIRVWVPGCSSGEEVYSLAILLLEFLDDVGAKTPIQMFGTDISEQAIEKARLGIYPAGIERNVSKERLNRFFEKVENGYKIKKTVREMCLFSRHDFTRDPPFVKLDLISCRNVLIYFDASLQKRVVPIFHYSLNSGGFLWLGRSESPGGFSKLFALLTKTHKIYSKIDVTTPMGHHFHLSSYIPPETGARSQLIPERVAKKATDFQRDVDRIAISKYSPPGVVVNSDLEILQFRGRTVPYLEPASGLTNNNLLKMARQELKPSLRQITQSSLKKNLPTRMEGSVFDVDQKRITVNIEVIPINPLAPPEQRNFVIFFEESSSESLLERSKGSRGQKPTPKRRHNKRFQDQDQRINQLEQELASNKQYQKSMVDEFEGTKEELTATNEELQSTNEELQSTNEELETAKEELQSSNEELTTVNNELQIRNDDLAILGSDLNNLLVSVEIPILIIGSDHRIRRFTSKAEKVFNLISGDVGRPIGDIKPDFAIPDLTRVTSEVIETLANKEIEVQDREGHWFRLQVKPYKTLNNKIDGVIIALVDIDILKRRLTETNSALDYATSIANTIPLPLVVLDNRLRVQSANESFFKKFDLGAEGVGSDFRSILGSTEKIFRLKSALMEALNAKGELTDYEIADSFSYLGRRVLLFNAKRVNWIENLGKAILLSIEDITERRKFELALKLSEEKFHGLVESAYDVIIGVNSDGKIEFANQQAKRSFGYSPDELLGKPIEILVPEKFRYNHVKQRTNFLSDPKPRSMGVGLDLYAVAKDGTEFPVDISVSPSPTSEGTLITAIIRDISERKRIEKERDTLLVSEKEARREAEQANQSKDAFLATLSHELRTPLTSILTWSQMIQRANFDPQKLKHGIKTIEESAKTQGQLIDDLLDVTRIQSGKLALNISKVDPSDPVRMAVDAVRLMAESKQISIETKIDPNGNVVSCDPRRLMQVVWNLLTNAIKFSSINGVIQVNVESIEERENSLVSIRVVDFGKGIRPDFLPRLFERFSQADSTAARVHGGLGLGLSIVRDLVRLQGGSVRAESAGLGKGSTFTVLLPAKSGTEPKASNLEKWESLDVQLSRSVEQPDLTGLRILVVEDEPSTLDALTEALNSFGASTIATKSAPEALNKFESSKANVLVSDIAMPGEDGYSLIRKIRALGSDQGGGIPALALTAYATIDDANRAMGAGFNAHMAKPFDTVCLGRAVAELAARKNVTS